MTDATRELEALLEKKGPDGQPLFSDDEVREVVPLLAAGIARGFPGAELPKFVVECIGDVAIKAGIDQATPAAMVWPTLERYYLEHPSPLVAQIEGILRRVGAGGAIDGARAAAAALGVVTSMKPLDGGERPGGTVPAGPAARFAALKQTPKK